MTSTDAPTGEPAAPTPARRAPTLEDVARLAGVSRATASRVVNRERNVATHLQERVRAAVADTGYVPNLSARSLVTRRTGAVAIVVSGADPHGASDDEDLADATGTLDVADPFFGRVVGGMLRALRSRDVDPVLMLAESDRDRARVLSALQHGNVDGALLVSTHGNDPLPRMLVDAGFRAVTFARPPGPLPLSFVDVAHRDGARLAADHLVARGCRDVAVIAGPLDVPAAVERLAGFHDAMARHGQAFVPSETGTFTYASGVAAMRTLLARAPRLDGVFASNDLMALGAVDALHAAGRSVPQDVAVVGFDDSAVGAFARPALTTVRQPIEQMASEMARILLDELADPGRRVTSVIFEPTLRVRDSA